MLDDGAAQVTKIQIRAEDDWSTSIVDIRQFVRERYGELCFVFRAREVVP
jgi:hypothetical protein